MSRPLGGESDVEDQASSDERQDGKEARAQRFQVDLTGNRFLEVGLRDQGPEHLANYHPDTEMLSARSRSSYRTSSSHQSRTHRRPEQENDTGECH